MARTQEPAERPLHPIPLSSMRPLRRTFLFSLGLPIVSAGALTACGGESGQVIDGPEPSAEFASALRVTSGGTVQDAVGSGCSTTAVWGLSKQIVAETNCIIPNALAPVPSRPNMVPGAATFAFLQPPARDGLIAALDGNMGMTLNVESMLRTVAQQYLLYAWYQAGSCGIQLAATPGNSNHEQGLAFDTSDYNAWMTALQSNGFKWYGSADLVHFDFVGAGSVDLNGKDVLAFQKLWNLNNPADMIAEDGSYGPATETRLKASPADGFPQAATCGSPVDGGSDDAGGHPDAGSDGSKVGDAAGPPPGDAAAAPDGAGSPPLLPDGGSATADEEANATPGDASSASSGCACRTEGRAASGRAELAVAALALSVLRRRRRTRDEKEETA